MSNAYDAFAKQKSCFGNYENWDNSWHCKGCIIQSECAAHSGENSHNESGERNEA